MKEKRTPYDALRFQSALSHGIAAALSLVGTVVLVIHHSRIDAWHWLGALIFGLCMIGLYTTSTLYHCWRTSEAMRIFLRKLDHAMIYILIAGTYTPICLTLLRTEGVWGWTLLGVIWGCALVGIIVKFFWINSPRWLASATYITMGWLIVVAILPLSRTMPWQSAVWMLVGGLFYTAGGVLYGLRWPLRNAPKFGCHEVFHWFIVAGSLCHWICIYGISPDKLAVPG